MKWTLHALALGLVSALGTHGATAPDFTVTDTRGTTHHLQAYLDAGKYVLLEFGYLE